jgi:L-lactate dehydrogenase complex protein LldE
MSGDMSGAAGSVQLFVTCLVNTFAPATAWAAVRVLERCGATVAVPEGQTCCGQPPFNAGYHAEARRLAAHTIDVLSASDDPVVVPSGSCASMIVHEYPALMAGDPVRVARAKALAARTFEFSDYLVTRLGADSTGACRHGCLAYHASCHGLRTLGIRQQPERLLARVEGARLVELAGADVCCGFGGTFSVDMARLSEAMLARKLDAIEASGADTIVVTDVGCQLHMNGGLQRRGSAVRVAHLADVLDPAEDRAHQP